MVDDAPEVTAAGIARLAGVGRAAVSNWRRRYPHFPQPVGGTETSPTFALPEVEEWLRGQGKLAEVPPRERAWQQLESDPRGAGEALAEAGERLLSAASGDRGPLASLAEELGSEQAYAFLRARYFDANPRQFTLTPPDTAALMAELAGPAAVVLDPACGSGELLAAASGPEGRTPEEVRGQEVDPVLARLTSLRLVAARADSTTPVIDIRGEDALRSPAPAASEADAVLCHPPFNERNWGYDELAYDPRWEYGLPARTESELAWVQHALAALRPGGTAVLLMPPGASSRRTGRRVRAALLRRSVLRAVIALPPGAAPPHSLALQLWVLRKPNPSSTQVGGDPRLLVLDSAALPASGGRGSADLSVVREDVLNIWRAFEQGEAAAVVPGVSAVLPVIDLLDDEVDLAPARHLPPVGGREDAVALAGTREELTDVLRRVEELMPAVSPPTPGVSVDASASDPATGADSSAAAERVASVKLSGVQAVTLGELARSGALEILTAGSDPEPVTTRQDDVVIPVLGGGAARVVPASEAGEELARPLCLLRVDPQILDPWFVAGFLRSTANTRQASSYASSATKLDARRLRLPRLPLADQRRYAVRFRQLTAFEETLQHAAELGGKLAQGLYDGLTEGTVEAD